MADAGVKLYDGFRFKVVIRNIKTVARPCAESTEIKNIRRPESATEVGDKIPVFGQLVYPADVSGQVSKVER